MSDQVASDGKVSVQEFCSQVWWLILMRGIAVLALGALLIARPGVTAVVLVQFLGAYFLVDGIFSVIKSVMGRKHMPGWGWGIVMGALEILTGMFVFANPILSTIVTASILVFCVALMAMIFGGMGIMTGIQVRKEVKGEWAMIAGGVLAIIFGLILLINPRESVAVYLTVMGIAALVGGVIQIFASFQIRQIGKKGLDVTKS